MPKGSFTSDTFEQIAEFGSSTAKKTVKEVARTFSPIKIAEMLLGATGPAETETKTNSSEKDRKSSHTPLDFDHLSGTYAKQDKTKVAALRNRLFRLAKSGEQAAIEKEKREREQVQFPERGEESERKKHAKEKTKMQSSPIPLGKQRRSIFSPKKMAARQQVETRPSSGKQ